MLLAPFTGLAVHFRLPPAPAIFPIMVSCYAEWPILERLAAKVLAGRPAAPLPFRGDSVSRKDREP